MRAKYLFTLCHLPNRPGISFTAAPSQSQWLYMFRAGFSKPVAVWLYMFRTGFSKPVAVLLYMYRAGFSKPGAVWLYMFRTGFSKPVAPSAAASRVAAARAAALKKPAAGTLPRKKKSDATATVKTGTYCVLRNDYVGLWSESIFFHRF